MTVTAPEPSAAARNRKVPSDRRTSCSYATPTVRIAVPGPAALSVHPTSVPSPPAGTLAGDSSSSAEVAPPRTSSVYRGARPSPEARTLIVTVSPTAGWGGSTSIVNVSPDVGSGKGVVVGVGLGVGDGLGVGVSRFAATMIATDVALSPASTVAAGTVGDLGAADEAVVGEGDGLGVAAGRGVAAARVAVRVGDGDGVGTSVAAGAAGPGACVGGKTVSKGAVCSQPVRASSPAITGTVARSLVVRNF